MPSLVDARKAPPGLSHGGAQDDYRLPEGMKRVGYDADTQTYIFKDSAGSLWIGAEGAEFGELKRGAFVFCIAGMRHILITCTQSRRVAQT